MEEVAACIENSRKYDLERGPCVRGDVATGGGAIPGRANLKSEDTGPIGLIAGPEAKLLGAGGMKKKIVLVLQTNEDSADGWGNGKEECGPKHVPVPRHSKTPLCASLQSFLRLIVDQPTVRKGFPAVWLRRYLESLWC